MYEKRIRERKEIVQDKIAEWLNKTSRRYPVLKGGTAITLSGPDPLNAAHALRGTNPKQILLYEQNDEVYDIAEEELERAQINGKARNVFLELYTDIHAILHDNCSCFYYDFCSTVKTIEWSKIRNEFENQMEQNRSFSVVYTLSLRGYSLKRTEKFIKNFNRRLLESDDSYVMKHIRKAYTYSGGGKNGEKRGVPMYVWAGVFLKGDEMPSNLREKHPGLFGLEEKPAKKAKEKRMKREIKKNCTKCTPNKEDLRKEMIHALLSNTNRAYSNQDIADMTGLTVRQIGAMAAWHTGKLAKKRK